MSAPETPLGDIDKHAPLLDVLVAAGVLDTAAARRAAQLARATSETPVAVIHRLALCDDARVVNALAAHYQMRRLTAEELPAEPVALAGVSAAFLRRHRVLPIGWTGERLVVGVIDPERSDGLAALAFAANCAAEPALMSASEQGQAFDRLYGQSSEIQTEAEGARQNTPGAWAGDAARIRDHADAGPAVRIVDALLEQALEQNASDIHIEPLPDRVRVRFRVDGALTLVREEPAHLAGPLAARIKILADMDVANRRSTQDGRTSVAAKGRPVDVRISSVPSAFGETVAMRLLRRDAHLLNLPALGFDETLLAIFEHVLALRRGLFLITGPTGSGKTTTLYAMIDRLRREALKILSIEDPIEYFFPDITQTQVNEDAGVTFPSALRAFLRQDPDVILIGEIRDAETARIAVQAALTGHLVLATLHTSDAPGAIARLADMGVDRFLIAATLCGAVSQRLIRRLCPSCRTVRPPNAAEARFLASCVSPQAQAQIGEPSGCDRCKHSGFMGRLAVAEGFLTSEAIRTAASDTSPLALKHALEAQAYRDLTSTLAALAAKGEVLLADVRALALT